MPTLQIAVDGRKAEKGLRAIQTSSDKTKNSLSAFTTQTKKAKKATAEMGKTAGSAGALIGKLFIGFSAFMAIRSATKTIIEFDFAMAGVKAVTKASEGAMAQMSRTARDLGATTQFSGKQAAEGMRFLGMAGFETEEILAAIPGTLNLALAGTLELGEAADIASNLISQFNLDASEMERIVDTLANTASSSNTSIRQLAEGMKFAGPIAGTLGISIEETAAAMGTLGDSGLQASLAGTGLRLMFAALLKPTTEAEEAIKRAGLALKDLSPESNTLSEIFTRLRDSTLDVTDTLTIFGRRGFGVANILKLNADRVTELTEANILARGRAQEMADVFATSLQGRFLALKSVVEELTLQVGEEGLAGGLRSAMDAMTMTFRVMAGMEDQVKGNVDTFRFFANVIETTVKVLGVLVAMKIAGFFLKAAIAARAFGAALTLAKVKVVALKAAMTLGLTIALDLLIDKFLTAGESAAEARKEFQDYGRAAEQATKHSIEMARAIEEGDLKSQSRLLKSRKDELRQMDLQFRERIHNAKKATAELNRIAKDAQTSLVRPTQDDQRPGFSPGRMFGDSFGNKMHRTSFIPKSPNLRADGRKAGLLIGEGLLNGLVNALGQINMADFIGGEGAIAKEIQAIDKELAVLAGKIKVVRDKELAEASAPSLSAREKLSALDAVEKTENALKRELKLTGVANEQRARTVFLMKLEADLRRTGLAPKDQADALNKAGEMFDTVKRLNEEREKAAKFAEDTIEVNKNFEESLQLIDQEVALLRLGNEEREIRRAILQASNEFEKVGISISESQLNSLKERLMLLKKIRDEQEALAEQERELEQFADSVGEAFVNSFEDAIFEGEKLSKVLNSLVKDVLKLTIRMVALQTVSGAISSGVVSMFTPKTPAAPTGDVPLPALGPPAPPGYAHGGVIVGERGPEAVFPLDRTASGDLGIGMPSGGGSNVTVTVVNNSGEDAQVSESDGPNGRDITVLIGKAVADNITKNGDVGQAIKKVFGVKRKGVAR